MAAPKRLFAPNLQLENVHDAVEWNGTNGIIIKLVASSCHVDLLRLKSSIRKHFGNRPRNESFRPTSTAMTMIRRTCRRKQETEGSQIPHPLPRNYVLDWPPSSFCLVKAPAAIIIEQSNHLHRPTRDKTTKNQGKFSENQGPRQPIPIGVSSCN
jgi:hypothetical protein